LFIHAGGNPGPFIYSPFKENPMTYPHVTEAWATAMEPPEIVYSSDIYGQIEFDIWFCVLQKGVGKLVYDPQMHAPGQRRTAITVNLNDLGGNNYKRDFIAEIATDGWQGITLPSLKTLGITDLSALNGAYVHAEMVKYATYKKSDGTEGVKTAPKILKIYKSLEECTDAAQGNTTQAEMNWDAPSGVSSANGNGATPVNEAEKQIAFAFLPAIVKSAVRGNAVDSAVLDGALKSNPIMAKHFNLGSPEVMQAIEVALREPAF
jgi:hypothetical protein